jgi:hypothetical protein
MNRKEQQIAQIDLLQAQRTGDRELILKADLDRELSCIRTNLDIGCISETEAERLKVKRLAEFNRFMQKL